MGNCKTRKINNGSKYYFNNLDDLSTEISAAPVDIDNGAMEQRVSLHVSLKSVDSANPYKAELLIYSDTERKLSKSAGFTETKSKNIEDNTITFEQFFAIPYFFEKQQLLDFKIYNNASSYNFDTIQTSLGSIMGSRGQTLKKKLKTGEDVFIMGKEIKKSSKLINFEIDVKGNMVGMGIKYSVTNLGTENKPTTTKLYDSETVKINKKAVVKNNINFSLCQIPVMFLNPSGNANENIVCIEINDVEHNKKLGEYRGPISRLMVPDAIEVALIHNLKVLIKCVVENHPSFISYLRSGMNINLTIGIDFTGSNGHYKDQPSYHYLDGGMNNYEKAIRSCGDIVAHYDNDQLFPVFGFGFCFIDSTLNNFDGKYTDFNYPINCNLENPQIKFIDGVLREYRTFITKIHLSGPTYFSPMINDLNFEVKNELQQGKTMNYHILMILTDGQIDDMSETKDALVEASFLPISVIIIGIGDGDFGNMDILDADEHPLYDRKNRKADRDLVQFVPFNNFKNNPQKLAEQVLEEIPRQVVEYYQHNHIEPKEDQEIDNAQQGNNFYDINQL
jgi:hypothetical protein